MREWKHLFLTSLQIWWLELWKEQLPAPLSSDGHSRPGIQPWALACSRGQQREVVTAEAKTTQSFLQWQRGLRLTTCVAGQSQWERSNKKLYMPEANPGRNCDASAQETNHKKPVYVPEFMGTWASFVSKLLLRHLSRDAATLPNWAAPCFLPT